MLEMQYIIICYVLEYQFRLWESRLPMGPAVGDVTFRQKELQWFWNGYRGLWLLPAKLLRGLQMVLTCSGGRKEAWDVCSAFAKVKAYTGQHCVRKDPELVWGQGQVWPVYPAQEFRLWSMVTRELMNALCQESCVHLQFRMFALEVIRGSQGQESLL